MKKPNFRLKSVYSDGSESEPRAFGLEEIDHKLKMSRRGFLALSTAAGATVSGCCGCGPLVYDLVNQSSQNLTPTAAPIAGLAHKEPINTVAFFPDGSKIASGSSDSTKIWDTATGSLLKSLTWSHQLAISSDSQKIACSGSTIDIYDVATGLLLKNRSGNNVVIMLGRLFSPVSFSPDGSTIAYSSDWQRAGDKIKIDDWYNDDGDILTGYNGWVNSLIFCSDGSKIASGHTDCTVNIWDVATGTLQKTLTGHTDDVNSVAFSPDGSKIASGSDDNTINIWDVATGTLQKTLTEHKSHVLSVMFSPDGSKIASGGWDRTVNIWDAATGTLQKTLTGHMDYVNSVAFSPDGSRLISGGSDCTIRLWNALSGEFIKNISDPAVPLPTSEPPVPTCNWVGFPGNERPGGAYCRCDLVYY